MAEVIPKHDEHPGKRLMCFGVALFVLFGAGVTWALLWNNSQLKCEKGLEVVQGKCTANFENKAWEEESASQKNLLSDGKTSPSNEESVAMGKGFLLFLIVLIMALLGLIRLIYMVVWGTPPDYVRPEAGEWGSGLENNPE